MILDTKIIIYFLTAASFGVAVLSSADVDPRGIAIESAIEAALQSLFDPLDPIYLPFFPTVGYNPYDGIDFSISLTNITMTGLTSVKVTEFTNGLFSGPGPASLSLVFPKLLLYAGEYSAGGHIANMPFTGESFLSVSFEEMAVTIGMEFSEFSIPSMTLCLVSGSTTWNIDIFKPVINFDQLNPGTDQGELVNTIFGAFVPDIVDYIVMTLNDPMANLHTITDSLLVSVINSQFCNV